MSVLLSIGGNKYFLDFSNTQKILSSGDSGFKGGMVTETKTTKVLDSEGNVTSTVVETNEFYKSKEVDGFRYETIRTMVDILFSEIDETDGALGLTNKSISFILAFNTLIEYGILNIIVE